MKLNISTPKFDVVVTDNSGNEVFAYHVENYSVSVDAQGAALAAVEIFKNIERAVKDAKLSIAA